MQKWSAVAYNVVCIKHSGFGWHTVHHVHPATPWLELDLTLTEGGGGVNQRISLYQPYIVWHRGYPYTRLKCNPIRMSGESVLIVESATGPPKISEQLHTSMESHSEIQTVHTLNSAEQHLRTASFDCLVVHHDPTTIDATDLLSESAVVDSVATLVITAREHLDDVFEHDPTEVLQFGNDQLNSTRIGRRVASALAQARRNVPQQHSGNAGEMRHTGGCGTDGRQQRSDESISNESEPVDEQIGWRDLKRFHGITTNPELSFDERIEELLEFGRNRLAADFGYLSRTDETTNCFEVVAAVGEHPLLGTGTNHDLQNSYCRQTIDSSSDVPLAIRDVRVDDRIPDVAAETYDLESYLGAPIVVDDYVYGTLCFAGSTPRETPFTDKERMLIELMTHSDADGFLPFIKDTDSSRCLVR